MTLLKIVLWTLPFILFGLISIKVNLPKKYRYVQFPLPILALILGTWAMMKLDELSNWLLSGIYYLIENVSFLSFLDNINWAFGIMYIVNLVLLLGFMLIKVVLMPILLAFRSNRVIVKFTAGLFYSYDEENKTWHLKPSLTHARTLMNWIYIVGLLVSSALFILTSYFVSSDTLSSPFYPALGVMISGEFFFFLNGEPKKEEENPIEETPEEEVTEEVNYEALREVYEKTFADRISDGCQMPMADQKVLTSAKLLLKYRDEFEENESQEARLLFHYYSNKLLAGEEIEDGMLYFTKSIMEGKSVLFLNQFYEDSTDYVFLPVVRHLMKNRKILIILGRSGAETNVQEWFARGIASVNNFRNIWKINLLSEADADTSIAVLPMKDIYNQKILQTKSEFLEETSMVFVMDPTRLLSTMQIGLSCVVSFLKKGQKPQYIAYDRNCDGLVDSLSHVLGTSIEQVGATAVSGTENGVILWEADGKMLHHRLHLDVSRYLGVGTELAALALRSGVSQVKWLSYQKFPIIDMRWIVGQYYVPLCKITDIDVSQTVLEERFCVQSDMWALPKTENAYLIVEDEYNNQFETARQFTSRGIKQSFVHVISQNYWLRDYMADNAQIFRDDPKSIPNLAADYQRSPGNTVFKIVMLLISGEMAEDEIRDMLEIIDADTSNVYGTLCTLIQTYFAPDATTTAIETALAVEPRTVVDRETFHAIKQRCYSIRDSAFTSSFLSQLKVTYYLAEDENDKDRYMGSILYGHVYQKFLPGMFVTLDGKYYEVVTITQHNGVVVRRAADHISSRRYYRQIRRYQVSDFKPADGASAGSYGSLKFERGEASIAVDTMGYLEMRDYGDMAHAKRITVNNVEQRKYAHKNVLRIDMGEKCPESVRVTIANLLNELFVTIFPDSYEYIAATTRTSAPERLEGYIPELVLEEKDDYLYIIEDSLIDLGLLINVDRYFIRLMEIICDALTWHTEKLEAEKNESEAQAGAGIGEGGIPEGQDAEDDEEGGKKKSWWRRFVDWIKRIFRRKKKGDSDDGESTVQEPETVGSAASSKSAPVGIAKTVSASRSGDDENIDGEDSEAMTIHTDDPVFAESNERKPYSQRSFLLYGFETVPEVVNVEETRKYLAEVGFANNYLEQAREGKKREKLQWYNYEFEPGVHYCDFCGTMLGETFDVLDDGRERCSECSSTAITKLRDFKKLYKKSRKRMEDVFGVKIRSKLKIRAVSATTLAESMGETLVLSPGYDCRVLGYAYNNPRGRELWLENGAPSLETEKTLIHELTHIWQYENMQEVFEMPDHLVTTEGMAVWSEVQYLVCIGEKEKADAYVRCRLHSKDEYGLGLEKYLEKYPIIHKEQARKRTPFRAKGDPLA